MMEDWAVWSVRRSCDKDEETEKDGSEERRECCSLIIWLFMQNAESTPIRDGNLKLRGLIGRGPNELCSSLLILSSNPFFLSSPVSSPPLNPLSSPSLHSALHCSLASAVLSPSFVKGCHWAQGQSLVIPFSLTTLCSPLFAGSDAKRIAEQKERECAKQQVQEWSCCPCFSATTESLVLSKELTWPNV